jgi:hypothetical protein
MERQNSRRRKPPRTQESQQSSEKATSSEPTSRPLLSWVLLTLLVSFLAYSLRPDIYLHSWIGPLLGHAHRHPHGEDASIRPYIELHPEDHVFRAPVTHHLNWRVTTGERRPDGVLKKVFLINSEPFTHGDALVSSGRLIMGMFH